MKFMGITVLGCPFCGDEPRILPENPEVEGNAFARVCCINTNCQGMPSVHDGELSCDDRGSDQYKLCAIKRWNSRANSEQAKEIEALKKTVSDLIKTGESALGDLCFLLNHQKTNSEDGSRLMDGEGAHDLQGAIEKAGVKL